MFPGKIQSSHKESEEENSYCQNIERHILKATSEEIPPITKENCVIPPPSSELNRVPMPA
jgi:hypothetical protein